MPVRNRKGKKTTTANSTIKPKPKDDLKNYNTVNFADESNYNESYINFYEQGFADVMMEYNVYKPYQTYNLTFYNEIYKLEIYQKNNKFYQLKTIPTTQYEELPPVMIERVKILEKIRALAKSDDIKSPEYHAIFASLNQYMAGNFYQYYLYKKAENENNNSLHREYSYAQEQVIKASASQRVDASSPPSTISDQTFVYDFDNINKLKELETKLNDQKIEYQTQLKNQKNDFESQLKAQKDDYDSLLSEQKQNFDTHLKVQKQEIETHFQKQIKELEEQLEVEKKRIEQLQEQNAKLQKTISDQSDENAKLQKTVSNPTRNDLLILNEDLMNDLEIVGEIGYGGNGKVCKVYKKIIYALKIMNATNPSFPSFQSFINEYEIMNMLHHPNILKTFGIYFGDKNRPPSFLLEFCPNNLDCRVREISFSKVDMVTSIYQIVEGMKYVHFQKIIHRDLKPSNILITSDGTVKIADFGISKLITCEEQSMTTGIGTQKFMAPELINEEDYYDQKVDVYSFGILMYFILTGGNMPKITIPQIGMGKKAQIPPSFSEFSRNLINSCWNFKPQGRPSFDQIYELLLKNIGKLVDLSVSECKAASDFIKSHQAKIPFYGIINK